LKSKFTLTHRFIQEKRYDLKPKNKYYHSVDP
jgi:hypothetical protein